MLFYFKEYITTDAPKSWIGDIAQVKNTQPIKIDHDYQEKESLFSFG